MPIFGMNNGMIPIIAYNYGKRSKERILKTVKLAVIAAVVYMLIGFAVFQTLSGTLLKAFYQPDTEVSAAETAETEPGPESASAVESPSEAVLEYGEPAMRIVSICFLFAGVCVITISALQALGKGLPSLLISLIRQIAVILPLSYILAINFGLVALFWAFPVAEFIAMVISIFLFRNAYIKLIKPLGEKPTETLRSPTE